MKTQNIHILAFLTFIVSIVKGDLTEHQGSWADSPSSFSGIVSQLIFGGQPDTVSLETKTKKAAKVTDDATIVNTGINFALRPAKMPEPDVVKFYKNYHHQTTTTPAPKSWFNLPVPFVTLAYEPIENPVTITKETETNYFPDSEDSYSSQVNSYQDEEEDEEEGDYDDDYLMDMMPPLVEHYKPKPVVPHKPRPKGRPRKRPRPKSKGRGRRRRPMKKKRRPLRRRKPQKRQRIRRRQFHSRPRPPMPQPEEPEPAFSHDQYSGGRRRSLQVED